MHQVFIKVFAIFYFGFLSKVDGFGLNSKITFLGQTAFSFYNGPFLNRDEAKLICSRYGGHLAHIKNKKIQDFVSKKLEEYTINLNKQFGDRFYIGLYRIADDITRWEWSDKSKLNYSNWYEIQPKYDNEHCAVIEISIQDFSNGPSLFGFWSKILCNETSRFICQNEFGSSFISKTVLILKNNQENVTCTVIGDKRYSVKWERNNISIPSFEIKEIYQRFDVKDFLIRSSTIVFVDPDNPSDTVYTCVVNSLGSVNIHQLTVKKAISSKFKKMGIIPGWVDIIEATSQGESCQVIFSLPRNIEKTPIKWIHVDVYRKEISRNIFSNFTQKYNFSIHRQSVQFITGSDRFIYQGHITLQSYNGNYGLKSKKFECRQVGISTLNSFITASGFFAVITGLIVFVIFLKMKKNQNESDNENQKGVRLGEEKNENKHGQRTSRDKLYKKKDENQQQQQENIVEKKQKHKDKKKRRTKHSKDQQEEGKIDVQQEHKIDVQQEHKIDVQQEHKIDVQQEHKIDVQEEHNESFLKTYEMKNVDDLQKQEQQDDETANKKNNPHGRKSKKKHKKQRDEIKDHRESKAIRVKKSKKV